MPAGFRLGSGEARIQAWLATLNPGGAPSSRVQVDGPLHGLSAGGLQGSSSQKQGPGEGVLHGHPPLSQTCQFQCHIVFLLAVFVELFGLA